MVLAAAAAPLLVACGTGGAAGTAQQQPSTELSVSFWLHGQGGAEKRFQLACNPASGSYADPRQACDELAAHADLLRPRTSPCTLALVHDAAVAHVTGHIGARHVDRTFRFGCDTVAFRALPVLLTGRADPNLG